MIDPNLRLLHIYGNKMCTRRTTHLVDQTTNREGGFFFDDYESTDGTHLKTIQRL